VDDVCVEKGFVKLTLMTGATVYTSFSILEIWDFSEVNKLEQITENGKRLPTRKDFRQVLADDPCGDRFQYEVRETPEEIIKQIVKKPKENDE